VLRSEALENISWVSVNKMAANPVEPDLALRQSLPDLLRNLLRNPVEPDLALHQSLPELLRNPVEPDLALHQSLPELLTLSNVTWLCAKASQTFSGTFGTFSGTFGTFSGTSLNLTRRLHQCIPELFWAEDPINYLTLLGNNP